MKADMIVFILVQSRKRAIVSYKLPKLLLHNGILSLRVASVSCPLIFFLPLCLLFSVVLSVRMEVQWLIFQN